MTKQCCGNNKPNYLVANDPFKLVDTFFNAMNSTSTAQQNHYPPYNVIEIDEDTRVLELAVAGFEQEEIVVSQEDHRLKISAEKKNQEDLKYLYRGIAKRRFVKQYGLGEFWNVDSVGLKDGILFIVIHKDVPEDKKPKVFEILV